MGDVRLYNVIFPLWMAMYLTPLVVIPLLGNLIIDGAIIYGILRISGATIDWKRLRPWILSAWGLGFLADFVGALFLFGVVWIDEPFGGLDHYYIWNSPLTIAVYLLAVLLSAGLIWLFNYWLARKNGVPRQTVTRIAWAMAVITAPWMYLIPLSLFGP